jgi:hypothetical protein
MDLSPWIPAATTSGLLAVSLWLGRELISARLTKSIQHEFDRKLEGVRADLRRGEEELKAELRQKELEISALRSGALSALASRQAALDKRRLDAADQLWTAYVAFAPGRHLASSMTMINFESAAREAERDPKVRQFFEMLGGGFDVSKIDQSGADKARPFLTPMVWAVFSASRAVTMQSVMRWHVLKGGLGPKDYTDHEAIQKLVLAALPHYQDYLKKHGPSVYYYVLDALEQKLLAELRTMVSGKEDDKASLEQAAEIIRQAQDLQSATQHDKSAA